LYFSYFPDEGEILGAQGTIFSRLSAFSPSLFRFFDISIFQFSPFRICRFFGFFFFLSFVIDVCSSGMNCNQQEVRTLSIKSKKSAKNYLKKGRDYQIGDTQ